jgi:hypothetical protein
MDIVVLYDRNGPDRPWARILYDGTIEASDDDTEAQIRLLYDRFMGDEKTSSQTAFAFLSEFIADNLPNVVVEFDDDVSLANIH